MPWHSPTNVPIGHKGYAADFRNTLLPLVGVEDFEADHDAGAGNELRTKFCAAHSSAGLAVTCFAPFCRRMSDLSLPGGADFDTLWFERKCPAGLRGGRAPNLNVVVKGPSGVVGIEPNSPIICRWIAPHSHPPTPSRSVMGDGNRGISERCSV